MTHRTLSVMRSTIGAAALGAAILGPLAVPSTAHAWWRPWGWGWGGGVVIGIPPLVVAPPVYYPPPVYYAPPPVYYAPQAAAPYSAPSSSGPTCYAGGFVCPAPTTLLAGSSCTCANNAGGYSYGRVGG